MVAKTYYISKDRQYIFDRYYIKSSMLLCDNIVRVEVYAPIEKFKNGTGECFSNVRTWICNFTLV